jgi:U3 small nucleolar RNA-associated protein 13
VKWNTNSRHSTAAQAVLAAVLAAHPPERLLALSGCQSWVEGLLPYTEKHLARLTRLQMKSRFLAWLVGTMKPTALPAADDGGEQQTAVGLAA